jgi:hypothetical protein
MIQKRIQDKIDKGKVSYGIAENPKPAMVLPLMQEKALKENPNEDSGKLLHLTVSVFAKGRAVTREIKGPSRSTLIGSPPSCEHKRLYTQSDVPYMRILYTPEPTRHAISPPKNIESADFMGETVSSTRKKKRDFKLHMKKNIPSIPIGSNLVVPTIAYSMKQNVKKKIDKKQNWSFVSDKESYVPAISNYSYTPIPWKPIPLNKNILGNSEYSRSFYKAKKGYKYNVVNFSDRMMTPELPKISRRSAELSTDSVKDMKYSVGSIYNPNDISKYN